MTESYTQPYASLSSTKAHDDSFWQLYDLRVEVICPPGERITCGAKAGDYFTLEGEMLYLPPNQGISIHSLAAVLPLLAAKQRLLQPADWMGTNSQVACPDPNCKSRLIIIQTRLRTVRHGEVTLGPLGHPSDLLKSLRRGG